MGFKKEISVVIIGGAGFTGQELIRYLSFHPVFRITALSSNRYKGKSISEVFPGLARGLMIKGKGPTLSQKNEPVFDSHEGVLAKRAELYFLATPNDVSLEIVPRLLRGSDKEREVKVIDLSASFRLKDPGIFRKYYKLEHPGEKWSRRKAYGLPEANRDRIQDSDLVSNPGCYPTGAILGLLGVKHFLKDLAAPVMVDAKSGASGAGGRVTAPGLGYGDVNENFRAYKVLAHQHEPEITEYIREFSGYSGDVHFVPHLVPMDRGIFTTIWLYFNKKISEDDLRTESREYFRDEPFVTVMEKGKPLNSSEVTFTNQCHIQVNVNDSGRLAVITTIIDNLGKGAAGQAIQNANILFNLDETLGLN